MNKCKDVLKRMLHQHTGAMTDSLRGQPMKVLKVLVILQKSIELNYTELTNIGIQKLCLSNAWVYSGELWNAESRAYYETIGNKDIHVDKTDRELQNKCCSLFNCLPIEIKNQVHRSRALLLERIE